MKRNQVSIENVVIAKIANKKIDFNPEVTYTPGNLIPTRRMKGSLSNHTAAVCRQTAE